MVIWIHQVAPKGHIISNNNFLAFYKQLESKFLLLLKLVCIEIHALLES